MYSRPLFYDILVPKLKQPVPTKVLKLSLKDPDPKLKFSSPLEKKTEINIGDYSTSLEVKVSLKSEPLNFGVEKVINCY